MSKIVVCAPLTHALHPAPHLCSLCILHFYNLCDFSLRPIHERKTDSLQLMVFTHSQIMLKQQGVVFVSVWAGGISRGTGLQSQQQVNW